MIRLPSLRSLTVIAVAVSSAAVATAQPTTPASAPARKARAAITELPVATPPADLQVAPGFKVELLYSVPKEEQGSWVAITTDPKGRIIASDQYGGLYRITPPPVGTSTGTRIEQLDIDFTKIVRDAAPTAPAPKAGSLAAVTVGAHGLLYAFDSLYVMVNEGRPRAGVWRVRDTNGDDTFDKFEYIREIKVGSGEHGTHALVLSPDGKSIYFANGNHTDLPANMEKARMVAWGEDHLLPRMWDARGHARNKYAPGGYIARMDPDGKTVELFSIGFRNQYDIAFDQNGELFTYDSDMEWDQGSPWYMPTRINHSVSGGDYGWRSGAGRWPDYYADSLPEVVNIGPGSPTGVTFGTGAKFPAKYQRALFAADWTFGTLYAIHVTPDGASFRGEKEEFVGGKPLPLTDVIVSPNDGAMYFAVGGRRTQSGLYRVTYTGTESTAPAQIAPPTEAAKLRRSLEALHEDGLSPAAIDTAWPHLGNKDRFVRFAARVAIEMQPAERWAERALAELQPQASIEALIALARVGDKSLQPKLIASLRRLDFGKQPAELRLPLLRAWQLAFTRMGKPSPEVSATIVASLDKYFPHADPLINRELLALLVYLNSTTVVAKAVPLLKVAEPATITFEELGGDRVIARNDRYGATVQQVAAGRSDRQQIALAYTLRNATAGWTPELRNSYFAWFKTTTPWRGGASFTGFIKNIRTEAIANFVTDPIERVRFESQAAAIAATASTAPATPIAAPKGPGRDYTVPEAVALVTGQLTGRNFEQGKAMFSATACTACHRFGAEGVGIGPDISGAGNRYSVKDLLENIISPSLVISDQYNSDEIKRKDGSSIIGRVVGEENNTLFVMTNPFTPDDHTRVPTSDVLSRSVFPTSMMPPGLINGLNPDELRDLVAYILSGGDSSAPMFKK